MIVFITGCFHVYRGAPVDGVIFLAVAAWLVLAETRAPAPMVQALRVNGSRRQVVLTVLPVTTVLAVAPRYGDVDVLVVGGIGLSAVVVAATRGDVVPPPRRGQAWPYAAVGLAAALNELTAYLLQTSPAANWRHPAFSDIMNPAFGWSPTRGVLVLLWLAGGAWLLRAMPQRARAPVEVREPGPEESTP
ncbi:MAG: hypothetical protein WAV00_05695 [Nocardioides sp.]